MEGLVGSPATSHRGGDWLFSRKSWYCTKLAESSLSIPAMLIYQQRKASLSGVGDRGKGTMRPINSCSFNSSRYFGLFRSNVNGWGFFSPVLQRRSPLPFCLHGICSSLLSQLFHFGFQPSFSTEDTCKRRYYFFIITLTFFDLLGFFLVPFLI